MSVLSLSTARVEAGMEWCQDRRVIQENLELFYCHFLTLSYLGLEGSKLGGSWLDLQAPKPFSQERSHHKFCNKIFTDL